MAAFSLLGSATALAQSSSAERQARLEAQLAAERPIAAGQSYWLEELTSMEIRDLIKDGTTTVIIPTGGIEENGPYLATGKHNLIMEAICPELAANLGNALCAPVVKFVPEGNFEPPSGAMNWPGSISLTAETYEAMLTDIVRSMQVGGFKDIVMIGDSGGNQRGMGNVAERLNEQWANTDVRVHFVREFYSPGWENTEDYTEEEFGLIQTQNDGYHDDIWVTAMMMVIDPEQVRYRQRVNAGLASINGIDIYPMEDTIVLGEKMVEYRARTTADVIKQRIAER